MSEPTRIIDPTTGEQLSTERPYEEINRLRAQIRDLQSELSRRGRSREEDEPSRLSRSRRSSSGVWDETSDVTRDLPVRLMDEASKIVRSLTFAYLEQVRIAADVMNNFADEVFQRNQPEAEERGPARRRSERRRVPRVGVYPLPEEEHRGEERESRRSEEREPRRRTITDLATNLPQDLYSGFIRAIDRTLDIPGGMVDRFYRGYRETEEEAEPTLRERRSSERESPISAERERRPESEAPSSRSSET